MAGSVGEKIGEGVSADIHAWAPGQVVKLFKPGVSDRLARYEGRMTRAIFAVGGPAPQVLGEVTLDGRFGIVLPRLDGPTLLHLWQAGAVTSEEAGEILATLLMSVHRTTAPPDVVPMGQWMDIALRRAGEALPASVAAGLRPLLDRLPPGEGLCHCDLHPDNVIMTAQGPRIIDWTVAKRGPGALDLGCSHVLLCELVPQSFGDAQRQRALDAAMRSHYARLAGTSPAALTTAMAPFLPVIRAFVLIFSAALRPATRVRLLARLERDLRVQAGSVSIPASTASLKPPRLCTRL
jgi:hypothetical protein